MKHLKFNSAIKTLILLLSISIVTTSCQKDNIDDDITVEQQLITDIEQAEKVFEDHINKNDGKMALGDNTSNTLGISPDLFNELSASYNEMNRLIGTGEIKREWIGKSIDLDTKEIISYEMRGCNQNKADFGWTNVTVYMSTNSASWASVVGCGAVGLANPIAGIACGAIIQALNQFVCKCGYKSKVNYLGQVNWTRCQ